jgi:hypothetical protein
MLPGGSPAEAQAAMFQPAYIVDLGNNPNSAAVLDGAKQNMLDWSPVAPTTLCGGSGDPTVNFAINTKTAYNAFVHLQPGIPRDARTAILSAGGEAILRSIPLDHGPCVVLHNCTAVEGCDSPPCLLQHASSIRS